MKTKSLIICSCERDRIDTSLFVSGMDGVVTEATSIASESDSAIAFTTDNVERVTQRVLDTTCGVCKYFKAFSHITCTWY